MKIDVTAIEDLSDHGLIINPDDMGVVIKKISGDEFSMDQTDVNSRLIENVPSVEMIIEPNDEDTNNSFLPKSHEEKSTLVESKVSSFLKFTQLI